MIEANFSLVSANIYVFMYREGYVQKGAEGAMKIKFESIGKIGFPEATLGSVSLPLARPSMMLL